MKKLLSLFLALTMVFSFCCFFVSADGEEPEAYLWLTADESFDPSIQFTIPGEKFSDANYRIITHACFEGCEGEGEGKAYVNYYVYSKDATGTGDFSHLIQFTDFATHKTAGEGWNDFEFTFNPCTGLYGSFDGQTVDASEIGFVTIGIGFWQATGTVKCSEVRLNKDKEVVWAKSFGGKFDPESDTEIALAVLGKEGTNWGIVKPEIVDNGNIALDADIEVAVNNDTYKACLNDGAAYGQPAYNGNWFAFTRAAAQQNIDGSDCYVGELVYDFGEAKWWNTVRANMWEESGSGIGRAKAIKVLYSDDKEAWTEAGELTLGEGAVYWAEGTFDAVSSRYVKVQFIWVVGTGSFIMTNEVEVIGCEAPEEPSGDEFNGDVNGDGTVDSKDAIYLLRSILNPDSYPITFSGDVNGDCAATTADAIYLLRYTFFPEKYPIISKPLYPKGENIAEGKSYTTGGDYKVRADGYGDADLVKLTDGVKDTTGAAAPAGFNGKNANIIIDLEAVGKITGIIADLQGNDWGIPNPKGYTVNFAVSSDGKTWTDLGAGNQKAVLEQAEGWNVVDFYLTCETVEARYVKVNYVTPADYTGDHIWPSEIQVIGEAGKPEIIPITVTGDKGIAAVSDEKLAKLVDGVYADGATAFADERLVGIEWQGFDYTDGAENGTKQVVLVYDLGELTDLTGVKLGAYKERNSFVDLPAVKVYLSNDGETYVRAADGAWTSPVEGLIASTDRNGEAPKGAAVYFADWSARATLKAQYIKLVLTYTDPWAFLSEVGYTTEIAAAKVDTALDANKGAPVDLVPLGGVDIAIADGTATILTAAAGDISLDSTAEGDYRLARAGVITRAKWDAEKGGYVVTENAVNPWPNNREGVMSIADNEIGVFTISSGNIDNNGAAGKWVIWHIEVGDVLYVYDDVIAINHKIDDADSKCFVPEPIQPEEKIALPEGAIVLDRAGFEYAVDLAEVLYSAEETTISEFTGKDLNAFAVAIVDAETMKVTWFGNTTGRPDGVKSDVVVPANSYLFIVHMGKAADFKAYAPEVGAEIEVYNVNLEAIAGLKAAAVLTGAGFTYKNPPKAAEPTGTNFATAGTVVFADAEVTGDPLTAGYDKYKSSLNDGVASEDKVYTNAWCGIYYSSGAVNKGVNNASFDGTYNKGTLIIDLGEEKTWNQVRVHTWAANASGIRAASAIKVYSSVDGETWDYEGDMVLGEAGTVYWASTDTEFEDVTSQYVKVEVYWNGGVFCFVNEIEVYGDAE